ncbi:porin family protein [Parabacteroides sp. PF5-6]|uniref:porin family protein n=1 Tax=Parabacteroides sp. PF5-6 TaxID=1742403 RepID=UPI002405BAEF|nr:porin family protein [Parabacteroides sp. PF5-6]MDF9831065.1 hypothetical protein [Parabacteroides sp. PF5-6]
MRSFSLLLLLSFVSFSSFAQENEEVRKSNFVYQSKTFNLGATIGFNSTFPIVKSITIDDLQLEDIRLTYKVGVQASVFGRINVDRFFIQPSFSWQHSEGDIHFSIPQAELPDLPAAETTRQSAHLEMSRQSLQVPVHIGYHIVREGPYALSFLAGPTLKYDYNVTYKSLSTGSVHEFLSESNPFGLNIAMGISVQIWQLFFDFSYEFGLNQTETDFRNKQAGSPTIENNIRIDKRINVMSFSLGIIF